MKFILAKRSAVWAGHDEKVEKHDRHLFCREIFLRVIFVDGIGFFAARCFRGIVEFRYDLSEFNSLPSPFFKSPSDGSLCPDQHSDWWLLVRRCFYVGARPIKLYPTRRKNGAVSYCPTHTTQRVLRVGLNLCHRVPSTQTPILPFIEQCHYFCPLYENVCHKCNRYW